jgi:hypothetical protein
MVKLPIKIINMISKKASDFIILHEVGSKSYYERFLQKPTYPKGESGLTVGFGYDLGYQTEKQFLKDWSGVINLNFVNALRRFIGVKGEKVVPMMKGEVMNVRIPYLAAYEVFIKCQLPRYYKLTKDIYPELETLNEDTQGALVSMVFNRGNKLEGDSRKEMKAIVNLVAKQDYEGIAEQVEASKRLWENKKMEGLVTRREAEADLILQSIA